MLFYHFFFINLFGLLISLVCLGNFNVNVSLFPVSNFQIQQWDQIVLHDLICP